MAVVEFYQPKFKVRGNTRTLEDQTLRLQIIQRLLQAGADPTLKNAEGKSALELCHPKAKTLKALLEHFALPKE
jgi:ankyrin repeat protein